MTFVINHPQLQKEIDIAQAYGAGDKATLFLQLEIVRRSCCSEIRPKANILVLPGCELGYLEDIPGVTARYNSHIRYADAVVLDQGGIWYILKDRVAGRSGIMADMYFKEVFVPEFNKLLARRQEAWDQNNPEKSEKI